MSLSGNTEPSINSQQGSILSKPVPISGAKINTIEHIVHLIGSQKILPKF